MGAREGELSVVCVEDTIKEALCSAMCSAMEGQHLRVAVCAQAMFLSNCLWERNCRKLTKFLAKQLLNLIKLLQVDHSQK